MALTAIASFELRVSTSIEFGSNPAHLGCRVPTVLNSGPYRLFFYAGDGGEPAHIHVERDDRIAKFWLDPIRLQSSGGFSRVELSRIERLVDEHCVELRKAWDEYFSR